MAKFLRTFRITMLKENKMKRYFVYAFGEILLVVIGILIALWVNQVNLSYQNSKKEIVILSEIRENLITDTLKISQISQFHKSKKKEIYNTLKIISDNEPSDANRETLLQYFTNGDIFQIKEFNSNSVGYSNLINSGNIEILKERKIKNLLTQYYLTTSKNIGALDVAKNNTRQFKDYIIPKTINNWSLKKLTGLEFELENQNFIVGLNNDAIAISSLLQMSIQIDFSENILLAIKEDIKQLIKLIDIKIKESE